MADTFHHQSTIFIGGIIIHAHTLVIFITTHYRICAQHETSKCLLLPVVDNIILIFLKRPAILSLFGPKKKGEMTLKFRR